LSIQNFISSEKQSHINVETFSDFKHLHSFLKFTLTRFDLVFILKYPKQTSFMRLLDLLHKISMKLTKKTFYLILTLFWNFWKSPAFLFYTGGWWI